MAFNKNLDEFGTLQGVERPDRFAQEVWDETTFPLFCFLGQEDSGICGGTIAAWGGGTPQVLHPQELWVCPLEQGVGNPSAWG